MQGAYIQWRKGVGIFALTDPELEARLIEFRKQQTEVVLASEL